MTMVISPSKRDGGAGRGETREKRKNREKKKRKKTKTRNRKAKNHAPHEGRKAASRLARGSGGIREGRERGEAAKARHGIDAAKNRGAEDTAEVEAEAAERQAPLPEDELSPRGEREPGQQEKERERPKPGQEHCKTAKRRGQPGDAPACRCWMTPEPFETPQPEVCCARKGRLERSEHARPL